MILLYSDENVDNALFVGAQKDHGANRHYILFGKKGHRCIQPDLSAMDPNLPEEYDTMRKALGQTPRSLDDIAAYLERSTHWLQAQLDPRIKFRPAADILTGFESSILCWKRGPSAEIVPMEF